MYRKELWGTSFSAYVLNTRGSNQITQAFLVFLVIVNSLLFSHILYLLTHFISKPTEHNISNFISRNAALHLQEMST